MTASCHHEQQATAPAGRSRVALVGSPNAGKTSVFNHLTGLRARTGNYPGVTVARFVGTGQYRCAHGTTKFTVEDLPGCYSLHPVSPDEKVVADLVHGKLPGISAPDAYAVVVDVTVLERSLSLVAQVLALGKPTMVVLTMIDELAARGGRLDIDRFAAALGVPVVGVIGSRGKGFEPLRALLAARSNGRECPSRRPMTTPSSSVGSARPRGRPLPSPLNRTRAAPGSIACSCTRYGERSASSR